MADSYRPPLGVDVIKVVRVVMSVPGDDDKGISRLNYLYYDMHGNLIANHDTLRGDPSDFPLGSLPNPGEPSK
jgi:hypothetical protein